MQRSDRCSCVPAVPQCKIGSAKCSNFKPHEFPVVTAQQLRVGLCRPPRTNRYQTGYLHVNGFSATDQKVLADVAFRTLVSFQNLLYIRIYIYTFTIGVL